MYLSRAISYENESLNYDFFYDDVDTNFNHLQEKSLDILVRNQEKRNNLIQLTSWTDSRDR